MDTRDSGIELIAKQRRATNAPDSFNDLKLKFDKIIESKSISPDAYILQLIEGGALIAVELDRVIKLFRDFNRNSFVSCGGCGATHPNERCIGCFHVFEKTITLV